MSKIENVGKTALVEEISNATGIPKSKVDEVISAMGKCVADNVRAGKRVTLKGFFSVKPMERAARVGRNPATKLPMNLPACTVAKIKPLFDM